MESTMKVVPGSSELGEVIDSYARQLMIVDYAGQKGKSIPQSNIHEGLISPHIGHPMVDDRANGEGRHSRNGADWSEASFHAPLVAR